MTKMRLASVSLAFCLAALSAATTEAATKPPAPKVIKAKAPKIKAPSKGKAAGRLNARVSAQTWRNRQITPTRDRYLEIQQALYEQGYLSAEPSGVWNQESVDALRQFQADQKLSVTGRISSLSLIYLGLGPNHLSQPSQYPVPSGQ